MSEAFFQGLAQHNPEFGRFEHFHSGPEAHEFVHEFIVHPQIVGEDLIAVGNLLPL